MSECPELPRSITPAGNDNDDRTKQPPRKLTLLEWLDTLESLDEDFPEIEDLPPEPVDF
jgi:antitoxin VapB